MGFNQQSYGAGRGLAKEKLALAFHNILAAIVSQLLCIFQTDFVLRQGMG
jgi:hypothetical protein